MTEEQRKRLESLLDPMLRMSRRQHPENARQRAVHIRSALIDHLAGGPTFDNWTPEQWIQYAEKAAEGHDKPGVIKGMTMEKIRSGKPPEFFLKESNVNENKG